MTVHVAQASPEKARDGPPPSLCSAAPSRAPHALPQHAPASVVQKRSFFRPLASVRRARGVRLQGTRYPFRTSCPLAGHREGQSPSKWDHGSRIRCRRGSVWVHLEMSIRVASSVSPLSSEEISTRIAEASDSTRMAQVCEIRLEAWLCTSRPASLKDLLLPAVKLQSLAHAGLFEVTMGCFSRNDGAEVTGGSVHCR